MLALDPNRMLAGFGKRRVVDHKGPLGIGQGLSHGGPVFPSHGCFLPTALVDELLQGLLGVSHRAQGRRQAHPARKRLDGFAFALQEQPAQVNPAPEGLARAVKVGTKAVGVLRLQALEHGGPQPGRESAIHAESPITYANFVESRHELTE
jgi:hypothetical protein